MIRPRRNRATAVIRDLVRENEVTLKDLVYPLFLLDGKSKKLEISAMPGQYRWSADLLINEIEECLKLGIQSFVLFPVVEDGLKDRTGSYSCSGKNFYLKTITQIKRRFSNICLISDVALDPYSSDGHDGLVEDGKILNDETLPILGEMAVAQADAGMDIIGPSDMMDGRVGYIREKLDLAGHKEVGIMSYTAKYASAWYGPFRDALDSAPKSGDKKTYQMDPANKREALLEAELDESEGADFLMVKPASLYLDIIHVLSEQSKLPIAAYNVSGEYSMLRLAAANGLIDYKQGMQEMLLAIKRAGANVILTYFAKDFAESLFKNMSS